VSDGAIAAAYYPINHQLEMFAVGSDGRAYTLWKQNNQAWEVPAPISPPDLFPPGAGVTAAYYPLNQQLEVFAVGNDGRVYLLWKANNGPWHDPVPISSEGFARPGGNLTVAYYPINDQLELLLIGNDGRAYVLWKDNNGPWHDPAPISLANLAPPGAAITCCLYPVFGQLEVFVAGNDGSVHVLWKQNNGLWQEPARIAPPGFTDPGACITAISYPLDNQLEVLVAGHDRSINLIWKRDNGPWAPPASLTPPGFLAPGSRLSSVYYPLGHQLEAFAIGTDGRMNVIWKSNNGAWAPPGAIEG